MPRDDDRPLDLVEQGLVRAVISALLRRHREAQPERSPAEIEASLVRISSWTIRITVIKRHAA